MVKSDLVFEVQDLENRTSEVVRARRLLLYWADLDGRKVRLELVHAAEHTESPHQVTYALRRMRERNEIIETEFDCDGLPEKFEMTWEPLSATS